MYLRINFWRVADIFVKTTYEDRFSEGDVIIVSVYEKNKNYAPGQVLSQHGEENGKYFSDFKYSFPNGGEHFGYLYFGREAIIQFIELLLSEKILNSPHARYSTKSLESFEYKATSTLSVTYRESESDENAKDQLSKYYHGVTSSKRQDLVGDDRDLVSAQAAVSSLSPSLMPLRDSVREVVKSAEDGADYNYEPL